MLAEPFKATHRHYKGGLYQVLGEALHTEDSTYLTIYRSEEGRIYARPKGMFDDYIAPGKRRFTPLDK